MTRTRIKICGITREADLAAAVEAGADAVGFVLYPQSGRYVTPERARQLCALVPPFVTVVGLFVNQDGARVREIARTAHLQLLQFHGDETPDYCTQFDLPYIKAARVTPSLDLLKFEQQYNTACGILLDAFVDGYGGGGEVFDWDLIQKQLTGPGARYVVSGGLRPSNTAAAIEALRPFGVDVSSGVESAKGIKDAALIRQFIAAVRAADDNIATMAKDDAP